MGKYDAPAQIDFVRTFTKQPKVTYIGHSQGTTQMFYAISANQEFWKERLNLWVALAPVTKLDHCKSGLIKLFSEFEAVLGSTLNFLGVYELLGGPASVGTKIACAALNTITQLGMPDSYKLIPTHK